MYHCDLVIQELEFDDGLDAIKTEFTQYITEKVLKKVEFDMKVYYTGLPTKKFEDYAALMHELFSGELIEKLSENDADESLVDNM